MKNKGFDYKKLMLYGGIPAVIVSSLGFVISSSKTITTYVELPIALAANTSKDEEVVEKVETLEDVIYQQQQINNYYYEKEKKESEVILSADGRYFWNEELQDWQPIKLLKKGEKDGR